MLAVRFSLLGGIGARFDVIGVGRGTLLRRRSKASASSSMRKQVGGCAAAGRLAARGDRHSRVLARSPWCLLWPRGVPCHAREPSVGRISSCAILFLCPREPSLASVSHTMHRTPPRPPLASNPHSVARQLRFASQTPSSTPLISAQWRLAPSRSAPTIAVSAGSLVNRFRETSDTIGGARRPPGFGGSTAHREWQSALRIGPVTRLPAAYSTYALLEPPPANSQGRPKRRADRAPKPAHDAAGRASPPNRPTAAELISPATRQAGMTNLRSTQRVDGASRTPSPPTATSGASPTVTRWRAAPPRPRTSVPRYNPAIARPSPATPSHTLLTRQASSPAPALHAPRPAPGPWTEVERSKRCDAEAPAATECGPQAQDQVQSPPLIWETCASGTEGEALCTPQPSAKTPSSKRPMVDEPRTSGLASRRKASIAHRLAYAQSLQQQLANEPPVAKGSREGVPSVSAGARLSMSPQCGTRSPSIIIS